MDINSELYQAAKAYLTACQNVQISDKGTAKKYAKRLRNKLEKPLADAILQYELNQQ